MDDDDTVEHDDEPCPNCGGQVLWAPCTQCEDGFIDVYDDDPLWYDEDDVEPCHECNGKGYHKWCSKCGYDLAAHAQDNQHIQESK